MDINFSIIDYVGVVDLGVAILLSLKIDENMYEFVYWFNIFGDYRLVPDDDFLELIGVKSIYEFKLFDDLIKKIEDVIPNKIDILCEFGVITKRELD